jgi:holo-[acyl-carrier protein] synthase
MRPGSRPRKLLKALGTGYRGGLAFNEVEVINDKLGKPGLVLSGKAKEICRKRRVRRIHLSLTHIKASACAVVIMEG